MEYFSSMIPVVPTFILRPRFLLWTALSLYFLLHLRQLSAPPNGYHGWRESDTAAIILNYYQEGMSFLEPRVNQRGAESGITGIELPVYQYTAAMLYLMVGDNHAVPRLLTLIAGLVALWLFYHIVALITGESVARWAVWAIAFSPLFFFYGFKIMPDMWMLAFWLGAVYLYLLYRRKQSPLCWLGSVTCLIVSAAIKPLGLCIYLPFLYLHWAGRGNRIRRLTAPALYIITTFIPVFAWYIYARYINAVHQTPGFYMGENIFDFFQFVFTPQFFKKLFLQWPPELWVGWVMVLPFAVGAYLALKGKVNRFYLFWLLAVYIVFIPTAQHSSTHDYYTLVAVGPFAVFTGFGLHRLSTGIRWGVWLSIGLLCLAPVGAILRITHRFSPTAQFELIRDAARRTIPVDDLVMVEDHTTAMHLYQLNRRGWPLRFEVRYRDVESHIRQGADFLILEKSLEHYDSRLTELIDTSATRIGPLYSYPVKNSY